LTNEILINQKLFTYQIVKKRIGSIRLKLNSSSSFQVSAPFLTPNFLIQNFIKQNSDWITLHSSKLVDKTDILDLRFIEILGKKYDLFFYKTQKNSVLIFEDDQKIYLNLALFTNSQAKKVLEKRLRLFALKLIKTEIRNLSLQYGFKYQKVAVRNQSSRYGSCSGAGNLSFNWQIVFFPIDKFQHILLHELTHLDIKNHSAKFWNQLTIYDSNCHQNNLWLKKEGTKHFLF